MVDTDRDGLDFDAFETFQEAVYALHNEHGVCTCPICREIRGEDERRDSQRVPEEVS